MKRALPQITVKNATSWLSLMLCLIPFSMAESQPQETATQTAPFVSLGPVTKQAFTDAFCTYYYKKQLVLIDFWNPGEDEENLWINLHGQEVRLAPQPGPLRNIYEYPPEGLRIRIDDGPRTVPRGLMTEGFILKHAKITISKQNRYFTLPVKGGCDGGSGYGS